MKTYFFADDDCRVKREISITATSEKAAHAESWAMLTEAEKNACGTWTCVDETEAPTQAIETQKT